MDEPALPFSGARKIRAPKELGPNHSPMFDVIDILSVSRLDLASPPAPYAAFSFLYRRSDRLLP